MIRHTAFRLLVILSASAGMSTLSAAGEPDPAHFTFRNGGIEFNNRATDVDLSVLDKHPELKTIDLSVNDGDGFVPLRPIAITNAGFAHIAKCRQVERVRLSSVHRLKVTDDGLQSLSGVSKLRVFWCGVTPFTDAGIQHLTPLENLEELWLDFNTHLTDRCLDTISRFKKLRVLRFYGAPITDKGITKIKDLTNLEDLQLGRSQVGDHSLEIIGRFHKLHTLDLQFTRVTDKGMSHLKGLKLRWLCLHDTAVSGAGLAAISNMTGMKYLVLSYTQIDDAALDHLTRMKDLESCNLSGTHVTGAGLRKLATLGHISSLELNGLPITDADIPVLTSMKSLKDVELNHTRITPAGFRRLSAAGIKRLNSVP